MGWLNDQELAELVNQDAGGGKFLTLGNGDSVQGVFVGEGYDYYRYWDNNTGRSVVGTKDGIAKLGEKPQLRIMKNFVTTDGNVQIFEGSKTFFKNLDGFIKTNMIAEDPIAIGIARAGEGLDTRYELSLALVEQPDGLMRKLKASEVLNNYNETDLHNLEDIIAPQVAAFAAGEGVVNVLGGNVQGITTF